MTLNKNKCGVLKISRNKSLSKKEIALQNINGIPLVERYKYLGITFDKALSP